MKMMQIGKYLNWWCEGCKTDHRIPMDGCWTFNGSFDSQHWLRRAGIIINFQTRRK